MKKLLLLLIIPLLFFNSCEEEEEVDCLLYGTWNLDYITYANICEEWCDGNGCDDWYGKEVGKDYECWTFTFYENGSFQSGNNYGYNYPGGTWLFFEGNCGPGGHIAISQNSDGEGMYDSDLEIITLTDSELTLSDDGEEMIYFSK